MSLVSGLRSGLHEGLYPGLNPGSEDPLAGVTRDALSGIYCPANATEWAIVMAAAGIGSGGPSSAWLCNELASHLADAIGGVTLTQTGSGHVYGIAVTGWERFAVLTFDGTAGQKWINTTTAANPATTDTALLAYLVLPVDAPAASRDVMGKAAAADLRYNVTGKLRPTFGAAADLTTDNRGTAIAAIMQVDNTNSVSACYTSSDKLVGTYALPASAALTWLGGQTAAAATMGYLYAAEFTGVAARLTSAQWKTLLQTLGWNPPWAP